MRLCTRCDRDESVGVHIVLRREGKEVDHICLLPGQGDVVITGNGRQATVELVTRPEWINP